MHNTAFSGDSNQRIIKEQYSFPISLLNKDSRVSGRNGKMSIYFTHPCLSTNGKMAAGRSRMNEQENTTWSRPSDIRADGEADILCLAQTSPCDEVNNVLSKTCLSLSEAQVFPLNFTYLLKKPIWTPVPFYYLPEFNSFFLSYLNAVVVVSDALGQIANFSAQLNNMQQATQYK